MSLRSRTAQSQVLAALLATLFLSRLGVAAPGCGESGQPWVSVSFGEGPWNDDFKREALQDLKAGLASRNIETCAQGQGPERSPVAVIVIRAGGNESVQVTVEIRDAVTEKRVSRDVDFGEHAFRRACIGNCPRGRRTRLGKLG